MKIKNSPTAANVMLHFGLALISILSAVFVIGLNTPKHVLALEALNTSGTLDENNQEQIFNFSIPIGANHINVDLTGDGDADYDINYFCDAGSCSESYNSTTLGTSTENISLNNPSPIQDWQLSVYLASGTGTFNLVVTYTFADGATLLSTTGSVSSGNSQHHTFATTENNKALYVVVSSEQGSTGSFDVSVDDPDFNNWSNYETSQEYKIVKIDAPIIGTYGIDILGSSGTSNYYLQVFTQDYAEINGVQSPIIDQSYQNFFSSATSASSFDLNMTDQDNMVVVTMGYKTSSPGNTYVTGLQDQGGNYNFVEACRSTSGNSFQTVIYYVPWNNAANETVTFTPLYANAGGISQLYVAAYGVINSGGVNMPLTGSDCVATSANNATLSFPNVKSNDLVIGSVYSLVSSNITSIANALYAPVRNGTSIFRVSNTYGSDMNYNMHTNSPFAASGISIRPLGRIHSPYSADEINGGGGGPQDTTNPVLSFTTSPGSNAVQNVPFEGSITDDTEVSSLSYTLDGGDPVPVDLSGDATNKTFTFIVDSLSLGAHTVVVTAFDSSNNTDQQTFEFDVNGDAENPVLDVTTFPTGTTGTSVTFEGTITDNISVGFAEYYLNGNNPVPITLEGVDNTSKTFSFTINNLTQASNHVFIYAYDSVSNSSSQEFNFNTDIERPFCDLTSQPSVVNSATVTYTNIHCTDNVGIAGLHLTVTKDNIYDQIYDGNLPASVTQDNSFGGAEEIVTFTIPISLPDGIVFVKLNPTDTAGSTATYVGSDFFTVEAQDNTAPTLYLERIRPDPTMDDTPKVTGSCSDNSLYDTNTTITNLEYRLDGGSWQSITTLDGNLGGVTEEYSFELPTLTIADHTIEVQCTDAASHVSTKSDTFTVIAPVSSSPTVITETEGFDDHTNHVLSESNLIWGNGKLRLRETISTTRTSIDTSNYPTKYINTQFNRYLVAADATDSNRIWYSKTGEISSYTISNNQVAPLDPPSYGQLDLGMPIIVLETSVYNGKSMLWVANNTRLEVYNLTDHQAMEIVPIGDIINLTPDTRSGRLGAYVLIGGTLKYLDLNGTLTNTGDDTFTDVTGVPSGSGLDIYIDNSTNDVYIPRYNIGMGRLNDNNTPLNFSDDTYTEYTNGQFGNGSIFSVMVDPNGYLLVGMASGNQTGGLYVVLDHNTTPTDASDDTILKLVDSTQIKNLNVYGITYIAGHDGVGDQLFLSGELGDAFYLNFNDTYTDLLDDTVIRLPITTNNRGVDNNSSYRGSALFIVKDYNTLYVNGDLDGFQRYDLTRGWEDNGQAVVYSTPENRLVANYFELQDIQEQNNITIAQDYNPDQGILSKINNLLFPKVKAQVNGTVTYSVSVDDGVTWSPITLSEILNMTQNDYRVKFKIEMVKANNSTPVIDSYTLAFGAYQDQTQSQTYSLNLSLVPSTIGQSQNFTLIAKVIDELGFTNQNYNGSLNLNLIDSGTLVNKNSLINVGTINLVNGEATLNNVQISAVGTYKITADYNSVTYLSNTITVVDNTPTPVPAITFTSNKYSINLGETATLTWATQNLTSLSINRGIGTLNTLNGSVSVSPTTTTVYTLSGTGPYGDKQASVTITVVQPAAPVDNGTLDADNDGLTNAQEATLGTNPNDPDSDDDGLLDGEEIKGCVFIAGTTTCSTVTFNVTDPLKANTDGDSLLDGEEVKGCIFSIGTTTCSSSTFSPTDPTDPNDPAKLPVSEVENTGAVQTPTTTVEEPVAQKDLITTISESFTNSAKEGTLPTALVATTTTATALTAVAYPNVFSYAFVWFRKRKKKEAWGLVYDITNNKPIPFVTVRILDSNNKFVAEEISDIDGKYSMNLKPGNYALEAKVNDYNEYQMPLSVSEGIVNADIAMTPLKPNYNWRVVLRNWLKTNLPKINLVIFFLGFVFSLINLIIAQTALNVAVLIIFIVQLVVYYWLQRGKTGKVYDSVSGKRIKGVLIRIFEESGRQFGSVATNSNGMYNIFLKPGNYIVKVESYEYKIAGRVNTFKDAVGTPYLKVSTKKEELLNLEIPMERKSNEEMMASTSTGKFGYLS